MGHAGTARGLRTGHTGPMITLELATALHRAGLAWSPLPGDRFALTTATGLEQEVFYLADMTVEVQRFSTGPVVGFNGTTEWALDSVALEDTLWLPREDQLREALGEAFVQLERLDGGYAVVHRAGDGGERREVDLDPERAYARALLRVLATTGG